jgi:alpha-L-fucosidase 2
MTFEAQLSASVTAGARGRTAAGLHVRGADEVVLRLAAATSFDGYDKSPVRGAKSPARSPRRSSAREREAVRRCATHTSPSHRALMDPRVARARAGTPPENRRRILPTDERINTLGAKDLALVALLLPVRRYLLIASSRPGTQPANLQGIWNDETRPPWSSNYTTTSTRR